MKAIAIGTYYQILNMLRVRKAFFFTCVFPIFLYILFVYVWGNDTTEYTYYIISGIVAITVVSNSLMAISRVALQYDLSGITKVLKAIPNAYNIQIIALILSRFIILSFSFALLALCALLFSGYALTLRSIVLVESGILLGIFLFSLLGIVIGILLEDKHTETTVTNGVFYIIIFLSDAFFPLSEINPLLDIPIEINPITPILNLMRNDGDWVLCSGIWIILLLICYHVVSKQIKSKR